MVIAVEAIHTLTHVTMNDSRGSHLVPACTCGWYSPDGSHWRFERHLRTVLERQTP